MSDIDDIRNLLGAACHAADDRRFYEYQALFAPDGVLIEEGREVPRARLADLARTWWAARDAEPQPNGLKHLTLNHRIDVDGTRASAISDLMLLELQPGSGWRIAANGRYHDQLAKLDGDWKIRRRAISWFRDIPRSESDPVAGERLHAVLDQVLG